MVAFSITRSAISAAGRLTAAVTNNARIRSMEDSIAHPSMRTGALELPAWKGVLSITTAVLLGLLFIVSGVWKITDPIAWATLMIQAKVPADLGLPAAVFFGTAETFAGVLL